MKAIRAMFCCNTVIPSNRGYDTVAHLHAVTGEDPVHKLFTEATPSGEISIQIDKDVPAHKFFKQGREYYVDFILVPLKEG